jgi:hypothetical protein
LPPPPPRSDAAAPARPAPAKLNSAFAEAREEIENAKEDVGTTYFNESHADAQKLVLEATERYEAVLERLGEAERAKLQRSNGMKMLQLKAELSLLDELHD